MKNLPRDAAVGAMILASVVLLAYMAVRIGSVGGYRGGQSVTMIFDDVSGLVQSAPVAAAGVKVGAVTSISFDQRAGGAIVHARIDPKLVLYADATATIRAKSLLGEKFVGLDPGTEAAGPHPGGNLKTLPAGDIERMAAAFARAAEAMDPEDVKSIVHGLAVALSSEDGVGASVPAAIRDVGRDLHRLAQSLESVSGQSGDVMKQLKPILARLDEATAKAGRSIDGLQPSIQKLPATIDHLDQAARRIEAVLAKADQLDVETLKLELRKILAQDGVYIRMRPRKFKGSTALPDDDETQPGVKATPMPTPPGLQR